MAVETNTSEFIHLGNVYVCKLFILLTDAAKAEMDTYGEILDGSRVRGRPRR
jgi:hypothetical protein